MSEELVLSKPTTDPAVERALVQALRPRKGRATLGDLVVDTGLPKAQVEENVRAMLSLYRSHLAVDEAGELLYQFDPALKRRDGDSKLRRVLARVATFTWWLFALLCKVGVMVVLVGYFVLFVVLTIAAVTATQGRSRSRSRASGSLVHLVFRLVISIFYVTGRRRVELQARGERARPFYKKVFAFAFGPEAAERWGMPTPATAGDFRRRLAAGIRSALGVLSATDLVRARGWSLAEADQEATRAMADYEGDAEVSDDGRILYSFPALLASAGGPRQAELHDWHRHPERPRLLTGNPTRTNVLIGLMNGFNLIASSYLTYAAYAGGLPHEVPFGLTWIPLGFSTLVFVLPVLRAIGVARENSRRRRRNVRRALLAHLFTQLDRKAVPELLPDTAPARVLKAAQGKAALVRAETEQLLRDLEGEPEATDEGEVVYRFPALLADQRGARALRKQVDPASLKVQEIVYSSAN